MGWTPRGLWFGRASHCLVASATPQQSRRRASPCGGNDRLPRWGRFPLLLYGYLEVEGVHQLEEFSKFNFHIGVCPKFLEFLDLHVQLGPLVAIIDEKHLLHLLNLDASRAIGIEHHVLDERPEEVASGSNPPVLGPLHPFEQ